jgi:uracil-DNA glycosylase
VLPSLKAKRSACFRFSSSLTGTFSQPVTPILFGREACDLLRRHRLRAESPLAAPRSANEAEIAANGAKRSGAPDPATAPRAHRDRREVERKLQLLDLPHIATLTAFVRGLSADRGVAVPWFDPRRPGPRRGSCSYSRTLGRRADAAQGSGFISADNDDKSAENTWSFFRQAGIDRRRDIVAWNIVPWYLGDQHKIGDVTARDIEEARPTLLELLSLLPELRAVVLFGRKAQAGWRRARPTVDVPVLEAPHPAVAGLTPIPKIARLSSPYSPKRVGWPEL